MEPKIRKEPVDYPQIGRTYKHYKGGLYEVVSMATHSETQEPMVIYKSLLFGSIYVRPLSSWNQKVKYTNRTSEYRFQLK